MDRSGNCRTGESFADDLSKKEPGSRTLFRLTFIILIQSITWNLISLELPQRIECSGLHAVKSDKVDAPVITEYPLTTGCTMEKFEDEPYGLHILGRIVNTLADDAVLDEKRKVDAGKLHAFAFDQVLSALFEGGDDIEPAGIKK